MKTCPACHSTYPADFTLCPRDGTALSDASEWTEGAIVRGKFRILGKIGQGGMGSVYKALHIRFDELRALKLMHPDLARNATFVKRFMQEAAIARKLQHPNAVRVEDVDEAEDGRPFIVMEYVEGRTLAAAMQPNVQFPVARACAITKQVASALSAAHALGMIHRDIKPDNIFLVSTASSGAAGTTKDSPGSQSEVAKVLDFGIAKIKDARSGQEGDSATLTGTGALVGTPAYMSPEQAMGKRGDDLDGRSDLYSLGIVMYQMLAGALPLVADSTVQMLVAQIQTPPEPIESRRPNLPRRVAEVVMNCLEKDPARRPADAAQLIALIEAAERIPSVEYSDAPLVTDLDATIPLSPRRPALQTPVDAPAFAAPALDATVLSPPPERATSPSASTPTEAINSISSVAAPQPATGVKETRATGNAPAIPASTPIAPMPTSAQRKTPPATFASKAAARSAISKQPLVTRGKTSSRQAIHRAVLWTLIVALIAVSAAAAWRLHLFEKFGPKPAALAPTKSAIEAPQPKLTAQKTAAPIPPPQARSAVTSASSHAAPPLPASASKPTPQPSVPKQATSALITTPKIAQPAPATTSPPETVSASDELKQGLALLNQHDFKGAQKEISAALEQNSNLPGAHLALGNALAGERKPKQAIKQYQDEIQLNPNSAEAYGQLGAALNNAKRFGAAIKAERKAVELDPTLAQPHLQLGFALAHQQKWLLAANQFHQALLIDPKLTSAHVGLGAAFANVGMYVRAYQQERMALQEDPNSAPAHFQMGRLLELEGKPGAALGQLRKACQLAPLVQVYCQQAQRLKSNAPSSF